MFLLNPCLLTLIYSTLTSFTSHYVPIKSMYRGRKVIAIFEFTSHYVPIKSNLTHYLVIYKVVYLHPIMFLLNLKIFCKLSTSFVIFTSHYVPIKSFAMSNIFSFIANLHPIMFLLNRYHQC